MQRITNLLESKIELNGIKRNYKTNSLLTNVTKNNSTNKVLFAQSLNFEFHTKNRPRFIVIVFHFDPAGDRESCK